MPPAPQVQPLPRRKRQVTFILFLGIFLVSLPFLFFYATGYRFDFGGTTNFIGTGGMYIAVERTGAEAYIDGERVRDTRSFRRAFYAQDLEPGTHRVHVQREGHQTWVKELPVSVHLVTEAQAFNLPVIPSVRVITPFVSATGSPVLRATSTLLMFHASTTQDILATTTKATSTFSMNVEYQSLITLFGTTSTSSALTPREQALQKVEKLFTASTTATSTEAVPTTTKEWRGVRLSEDERDVYARWIDSRDSIPYYYCSEEFPPYSTTTETGVLNEALELPPVTKEVPEVQEFSHPVQTVSENVVCDPVIKIDRKGQTVHSFDFYPGSIDLVLMSLDDGAYVVEIDDRSWQNVQPLVLGDNLTMRVSNGQVYVYDGKLIYQVILEEY